MQDWLQCKTFQPHALSPLELPVPWTSTCMAGSAGQILGPPDTHASLSALQHSQATCHSPVACLWSFCVTSGLESPFPVSLLKSSSLLGAPLSSPLSIQPDDPPHSCKLPHQNTVPAAVQVSGSSDGHLGHAYALRHPGPPGDPSCDRDSTIHPVFLGPRLRAWHILRGQYMLAESKGTQLDSTAVSPVPSQRKRGL